MNNNILDCLNFNLTHNRNYLFNDFYTRYVDLFSTDLDRNPININQLFSSLFEIPFLDIPIFNLNNISMSASKHVIKLIPYRYYLDKSLYYFIAFHEIAHGLLYCANEENERERAWSFWSYNLEVVTKSELSASLFSIMVGKKLGFDVEKMSKFAIEAFNGYKEFGGCNVTEKNLKEAFETSEILYELYGEKCLNFI